MRGQPLFIAAMLTLALVGAGSWTASDAQAQQWACAGDCNHDDRVTVDELVTGVNMALDTMPIGRCPDMDRGGDEHVTIDDLIAAVTNALQGCSSRANHPPHASDVSFAAETSTPYLEKQLIGSDPDDDPVTYELMADDAGTGYEFAYLNPDSGLLYVTVAAGFQGTIVLPYHVTDGHLFSNTASVTVDVQPSIPVQNTGLNGVDPKEYAGYPRGFYDGGRLGAPGADPTLPTAVDLSKDFPLPGRQGNQSSCVGWATAYAIKSYQERVEIGWSLEPAAHRFSPAYIYNQINGGFDNGSWFTDALDVVVQQGVATLDEMPYNDHDYLSQPSPAARDQASHFKALRWKTVNGVLEIKDALANHLPVLVGLWAFGDLEDLSGANPVYNTFGGGFEGGHAVTVAGYDDTRYGGAFRIINSWGQDYADGGYFWLPYSAANTIVNTPEGPEPVLSYAYVLEDAPNTTEAPPDPVDPTPTGELPDLQVTDWKATFNGTPGGSGSLQYTVTNTGTGPAPAGAYVALTVSRDADFATNSLVVYERIPFDMAPGTTAYRDQNNAIAFNFPYDLEAGQYYMAFKADIFNDVVESREDDNFSAAMSTIDIVNTLPDMEVITWYSSWDELGDGTLTYSVVNNGASTAAAGWQIALALSPDDTIGDGDDIVLFSEPANFALEPGGTLFRDPSGPASFLLYFDRFGNPVPDGVYYVALSLDPDNSLAESNEHNNTSLSWGTIRIGVGAGLSSDADARSAIDSAPLGAGEAYNGKTLPQGTAKVRLSTLAEGGRRTALLADSGPSVKPAEVQPWSKTARARQQVIFPVTEMKPMP